MEHNSVLRPLRFLEKEKKIDLSICESKNGFILLKDIKKLVKSNTALVVLNHASNVLGTVQNTKKIGSFLKKKNIFFVVDIAQSAGTIPFDFDDLNCDAFCFTGHKGLFGSPGLGGFYIDDPNKINQIFQGGTGVLSEHIYHPDSMPLKFEVGTPNYVGVISLYEGLNFLEKISVEKINKKLVSLSAFLIGELKKIKKVNIHNENPCTGIVSFNIKGLSSEDISFILAKNNIIVRSGLHCAPLIHKKITLNEGSVRVSFSYFNSKKDCVKLLGIIKKIV